MAEAPAKKIVIIGGGIVGVCTAYYLTRNPHYDPALHSIVLLEASGIASGSSGKGGGFIASWAKPQCIAPLSFSLHEKLAEEHGGDRLWGFRHVLPGAVELETQPRAIGVGKGHDVAAGQRPPSGLHWLNPERVKSYSDNGTVENSGQIMPLVMVKSVAKLAEEAGVKVIPGYATAINKTESSVESVTYNLDGETLKMDVTDVLVAAGPWSTKLLPSVKLLTPKGHSIVVRPKDDQALSSHILFSEITDGSRSVSVDLYARPKDSLNDFETLYSSGPDHYDVPLPTLCKDVEPEMDKAEDVWNLVKSVTAETVREGEVIAWQACYKAQIRKPKPGEEVGPMVGPLGFKGLWLATGLEDWGVQNGPGVGLVMSEMILEGKARSADVEQLDPKHWM